MSIKKLVSETAIYGVSSILGRILNFALVPFYSQIFPKEEYGIVALLFAPVAFLMVLFTYRIEVAYFRFGTDKTLERQTTFNTSFTSILISTFFLTILISLLSPLYADFYSINNYQNYIYLCIGIIGLDTLSELPYAELRLQSRPIRFAVIRLVNIGINLSLNLFFLLFCPWVLGSDTFSFLHPMINNIYSSEIGIGYIFISTFVASAVSFVLLSPTFKQYQFLFDKALWRRMMKYVIPLVVVGFAYLINEMLDKLLLPKLLPGTEEENKAALGVYSLNYKLAIIISLFTQAFRYGAEPFFFKNKNESNAHTLYALVAKYFLIVATTGFLAIALYLDLFKFIIGEEYWEGLKIVPIILVANVLAGLYYNFSVWYKLIDKTQWGAYISVGGAIITIALNFWWIPIIGYMGSAWATLICYSSMTIACYFIGRQYYPIPYPIFRMALYLLVAVGIYFASTLIRVDNLIITLGVNTLLLLAYLGFIYTQEQKNIRNILKGIY